MLLAVGTELRADVLTTGHDRYEIGSPVELKVDRSAIAWRWSTIVGLYHADAAADAAPIVGLHQMGYSDDGDQESKTGTFTFKAPSVPGTYEFRVFDRYNPEDRLAAHRVNVIATQDFSALQILGGVHVFDLNERIGVRVALSRPRSFFGGTVNRAFVGIYEAGAPSSGDLNEGRHGIHKFSHGQQLPTEVSLRAPLQPGDYELRLYDRSEGEFIHMIAWQPIEVVAPPELDVIDLGGRREFRPGEYINVHLELRADRYLQILAYGGAFLGTFPAPQKGLDPQDALDRWHLCCTQDRRPPVDLTIQAPDSPGRYMVVFFDRDPGAKPTVVSSEWFEVTCDPGGSFDRSLAAIQDKLQEVLQPVATDAFADVEEFLGSPNSRVYRNSGTLEGWARYGRSRGFDTDPDAIWNFLLLARSLDGPGQQGVPAIISAEARATISLLQEVRRRLSICDTEGLKLLRPNLKSGSELMQREIDRYGPPGRLFGQLAGVANHWSRWHGTRPAEYEDEAIEAANALRSALTPFAALVTWPIRVTGLLAVPFIMAVDGSVDSRLAQQSRREEKFFSALRRIFQVAGDRARSVQSVQDKLASEQLPDIISHLEAR